MPINIEKSVGLGGVNQPIDVIAVKSRLIQLGFDWLAADAVMGPTTISAIRLFQAIKNGFNRVVDPRNDGRVDVGGDTLKWLNATNAPRWQQMPAGSRVMGFINDNIADLSDAHDFGTAWLADTIRAAGAEYRDAFLSEHASAATLTVNDTSLPRGGDTPVHATHEAGLCCDIRLPRKNGTVGGITVASADYDRAAMRAMIKAFLKQPMASRVLLSDQVLVNEDLCRAAQGHHNHAHFEVGPPPLDSSLSVSTQEFQIIAKDLRNGGFHMSNNEVFETGFGNKGKRTVRAYRTGAKINAANGEFLSFNLKVKGAKAIFTFACMHKSHLTESSFPGYPHIDEFEWTWGKNLGELHHKQQGLTDDEYIVRMSFVPAVKYTLVVNHCAQNGDTIRVLKDIDYESQDPNDRFGELLTIF
jgi:hypothetical protein